MPRDAQFPPARGRREPVLNAPWIVLALVATLVAAHAWREMAHAGVEALAFNESDLARGRWSGLITHIFTHGGWAHVLTNAAFILAFGTPVARFLGQGARGAAAFCAFFVVCGVIAALAFAGLLLVIEPNDQWELVGASGAASGLMGAAARLMQGHGALGSWRGKQVVGMTFAWIGINVVLGISGLAPGSAGAPIAWEAHIFGYLAGLALIGVFARVGETSEALLAKAP
jgi:membrane associated rhomboid family serine protease